MKTVVSTKNISKVDPISINWQDNADIRMLLDVVVGIMAEEYVSVARKNEDVFKDPSASLPSASLGTGRMTEKEWERGKK